MEVSHNLTLGAGKVVPITAHCVVLVRLKGLNKVRAKLSVKEYAVTYFCKVNFFFKVKNPPKTKMQKPNTTTQKPELQFLKNHHSGFAIKIPSPTCYFH